MFYSLFIHQKPFRDGTATMNDEWNNRIREFQHPPPTSSHLCDRLTLVVLARIVRVCRRVHGIGVVGDVVVGVMHGVVRRDRRRWWWGIRFGGGSLSGLPLCLVIGRLTREAHLVLCGQVLVLALLVGRKRPPALSHHVPHVGELDGRILLEDLRTHVGSKEDVRAPGTLGCVGIALLLLPLTTVPVFLEKIALGIVARRGGRTRPSQHRSGPCPEQPSPPTSPSPRW